MTESNRVDREAARKRRDGDRRQARRSKQAAQKRAGFDAVELWLEIGGQQR
jgi:hypothetical protein